MHFSLIAFSLILVLSSAGIAYAQEPIKITISDMMHEIIFDGAWSFMQEWKPTSWDQAQIGDDKIMIRSAHQDGFLYILLDVLYDTTDNKIADRAIICLDSNKDSQKSDENDWCYSVSRGSKNAHTMNGGSGIYRTSGFHLTKNDPSLIAVGGTSGPEDKYLKNPHAAYEFRIPIEQIGYSDKYGIFIKIFDNHQQMTYPLGLSEAKNPVIPPPSEWGEMISPDRSMMQK